MWPNLEIIYFVISINVQIKKSPLENLSISEGVSQHLWARKSIWSGPSGFPEVRAVVLTKTRGMLRSRQHKHTDSQTHRTDSPLDSPAARWVSLSHAQLYQTDGQRVSGDSWWGHKMTQKGVLAFSINTSMNKWRVYLCVKGVCYILYIFKRHTVCVCMYRMCV